MIVVKDILDGLQIFLDAPDRLIGHKKSLSDFMLTSCNRRQTCYNVCMNTSLSIFARALASENISFSFDNKAETAAFDVENRHLMMPVWNVSETVQTMLVAHEISHALWTPYQRSEELLNAAEQEGYIPEVLQRIANIVEDVQIGRAHV